MLLSASLLMNTRWVVPAQPSSSEPQRLLMSRMSPRLRYFFDTLVMSPTLASGMPPWSILTPVVPALPAGLVPPAPVPADPLALVPAEPDEVVPAAPFVPALPLELVPAAPLVPAVLPVVPPVPGSAPPGLTQRVRESMAVR